LRAGKVAGRRSFFIPAHWTRCGPKVLSRIIRDRVAEIERLGCWPTDEEVRALLRPQAAVSRG
jgi:hypothetical protein